MEVHLLARVGRLATRRTLPEGLDAAWHPPRLPERSVGFERRGL